MKTSAKDILSRLSPFGDEGTSDTAIKKKGVYTSAGIGFVVGAAIGYTRNYNIPVSAVAGAVIVGFLGKYLIERKDARAKG